MDRRRITNVAVTLAVAFGTGYVMQNGSSVGARLQGAPQNASPAPAESVSEEVKAALPELPSDMPIPQFGKSQTHTLAHRMTGLDVSVQALKRSDAQTPAPFELAEAAS